MTDKTSDNRKQILHERAVKLAIPKNQDFSQDASNELYVTFAIESEIYGIDDLSVIEVLTAKDITYIPGLPHYYEGIINIRGKIIAIINFRKLMQIKTNDMISNSKVMVLGNNEKTHEFGIVVDRVTGTLNFASHEIKPPPQNITGIGANYLKGIAPNGTIIIDSKSLIDSPVLIINQSTEKNKQNKN